MRLERESCIIGLLMAAIVSASLPLLLPMPAPRSLSPCTLNAEDDRPRCTWRTSKLPPLAATLVAVGARAR